MWRKMGTSGIVCPSTAYVAALLHLDCLHSCPLLLPSLTWTVLEKGFWGRSHLDATLARILLLLCYSWEGMRQLQSPPQGKGTYIPLRWSKSVLSQWFPQISSYFAKESKREGIKNMDRIQVHAVAFRIHTPYPISPLAHPHSTQTFPPLLHCTPISWQLIWISTDCHLR